MKMVIGAALTAFCLCAAADPVDFGAALRASYPSLVYVERYRAAYPADVEGSDDAWTGKAAPPSSATAADVTRLLTGLADQHVALTGPNAGKSETLGVLFRTSADGHMIAWHVVDPRILALKTGEEIVAVNGTSTVTWLMRAARLTFGGNGRFRQAEAALNLGLGTPAAHEVAGLGRAVMLAVRDKQGSLRQVRLSYQPMTPAIAAAVAHSVDLPDLPEVMRIGRYRVGTVRIGAFAPQYDPVFTAAADAAAEKTDNPDRPMLAGFCAVTRGLIARFDTIARRSDLMVIDLRGNMGGFGREVGAFTWALTGHAPVQTYDVVASGTPGRVRLQSEPVDPSCGSVTSRKPLFVLVDAGTRSGGELLATHLGAAGATVLGERTVGAGGGRDSVSTGIPVGTTRYKALVSENFYVFDPKRELQPGDMDEAHFVERVAAYRFAPSRRRPYTTQAVGVLPDIALTIGAGDLRDGGRDLLSRGIVGSLAIALSRNCHSKIGNRESPC
jgi:hypothetical protein